MQIGSKHEHFRVNWWLLKIQNFIHRHSCNVNVLLVVDSTARIDETVTIVPSVRVIATIACFLKNKCRFERT